MAKLAKAIIKKEDIVEYLDKFSDFSFEVRVFKVLSAIGLTCSHSGTYMDPITGKIREYDIRASHDRMMSERFLVRQYFAVECKNITTMYPLVVHCVRRRREEAYLDVVISYYNSISIDNRAKTVKQRRDLHRYPVDDRVGKSTDQVGRQAHDNEIVASDGGVFEKISQAINSSKDFVDASAASGRGDYVTLSYINPILVVPDETLWAVTYDDDGNVISGPEVADWIPIYYGQDWPYQTDVGRGVYSISHLDVVTVGALERHVRSILSIDDFELCDFYKKIRSDNSFPGIPK
jgi:hypothetical protein